MLLCDLASAADTGALCCCFVAVIPCLAPPPCGFFLSGRTHTLEKPSLEIGLQLGSSDPPHLSTRWGAFLGTVGTATHQLAALLVPSVIGDDHATGPKKRHACRSIVCCFPAPCCRLSNPPTGTYSFCFFRGMGKRAGVALMRRRNFEASLTTCYSSTVRYCFGAGLYGGYGLLWSAVWGQSSKRCCDNMV